MLMQAIGLSKTQLPLNRIGDARKGEGLTTHAPALELASLSQSPDPRASQTKEEVATHLVSHGWKLRMIN
jgi:hypothetical protein